MTSLSNALEAMGLHAQVELSDRSVKREGERCSMYVVQGA
jgi:hypothetical protein